MQTLELINELIRIDSSTKEGANKAVEYAKTYMEQHGVAGHIVENEGYKSYICEIGEGDKKIILNGHLDVVSGKSEMFEPFEKDGKLFGRGSADMKSGCAAMMNAIVELKEENLPCKVMLQLVSDEEDGGFYGSQFLVQQGYIGDFVICGEPTNLGISIQSKGFMRLDIVEYGRSAHGSRPWEGDNAILKAMDTFEKIKNLPFMAEKSEFYSGSSINLAVIEGGIIYNKVPDKCRIGLDIRFVPNIEPERIVAEIEGVVNGDVVVNIIGSSVNMSMEHPYILRLSKTIKEVTKKAEIETVAQHGSSDARFFTKVKIPSVEFGPSGGFWHGDGEYLIIQSVENYEKVLKKFIMEFII